jgi:hypothetical protein
MRAVLAVSAHLDDAVLSAGQFIAGRPDCVIATVLAGTPSTKAVLTAYDAKTGFNSAAEAVECWLHGAGDNPATPPGAQDCPSGTPDDARDVIALGEATICGH